MVLRATLHMRTGIQRNADIELDYAGKQWSMKLGGRWPGVVTYDHGPFEQKSWGVIWLMDGPGNRNSVILRDAPLNENDMAHRSGAGRVYDPPDPSLKDCQISWRFLRRSPLMAAGATSRVRARVLEVCGEIFPQKTNGLVHFTSERRKAGSKVTNCGVFPGMVFGRVPVIHPGQPGAFKVSGPLYLTTPMTAWEEFAHRVDREKSPPQNTWIPFTGGNRPLPGDIYLLKNVSTEEFQHVGIIINSTGTEWITADGGQGDGFQGGFVRRSFQSGGVMTGEFGNQARLKGWVDLDRLYAVAKSSFPANLG